MTHINLLLLQLCALFAVSTHAHISLDWANADWYEDGDETACESEPSNDGIIKIDYGENAAIVAFGGIVSNNEFRTLAIKKMDLNTLEVSTDYSSSAETDDKECIDNPSENCEAWVDLTELTSENNGYVGVGLSMSVSDSPDAISKLRMYYQDLTDDGLDIFDNSEDYITDGGDDYEAKIYPGRSGYPLDDAACVNDRVIVGIAVEHDGNNEVKAIFLRLAQVSYSETDSPTSTPTTAPTAQECVDGTETTLDAVDSYYDDSTATSTYLTLDDAEYEIVVFSDEESNALYENACTDDDVGGTYVELSYEANCTDGTDTVALYVSQQPRCYASNCEDDDDEVLFETYALTLTEERNGDDWSCTGSLLDGIDSACELESTLINDSDDIYSVYFDINPTLESEMWMGIMSLGQTAVTYPDSYDDLTLACTTAGGTMVTFDTTYIQCGDLDLYDVYNFVACMGPSCEEGDYDDSIVALFEVTIAAVDSDYDGSTCEISESSSASTILYWIGLVIVIMIVGICFLSVCSTSIQKPPPPKKKSSSSGRKKRSKDKKKRHHERDYDTDDDYSYVSY